jgi:mevalonate kinase
MRVNYRRTFEKQREEAWEKRQQEREEFLTKMSPVEREVYLLNEKKRVEEAFQTMALAQSMLKDNPYSNL